MARAQAIAQRMSFRCGFCGVLVMVLGHTRLSQFCFTSDIGSVEYEFIDQYRKWSDRFKNEASIRHVTRSQPRQVGILTIHTRAASPLTSAVRLALPQRNLDLPVSRPWSDATEARPPSFFYSNRR